MVYINIMLIYTNNVKFKEHEEIYNLNESSMIIMLVTI